MQEDMHYYGTYAMARAAGINVEDANIIAYASQYVDDATTNKSKANNDGGMFETTATSHTNMQAIENALVAPEEQRKVWVPFHFLPGGEGDSLSKKLKCVKDSKLAQEMVKNHIRHAVLVKRENGLELMGIMAHVYADTFSHYGFSGVSSRENEVDADSFELDVTDESVKAYIMGKFSTCIPSFIMPNFRSFLCKGASIVTGALGHGAVGTYPDRPFLRWTFAYNKNKGDAVWRNNQDTFLEWCEKIHQAFSDYALQTGISTNAVPFADIKNNVKHILALEANKEDRIAKWKEAINDNSLFKSTDNEAIQYSPDTWEHQRDEFTDLGHSYDMINKHVYKFHQAAIYHRNYVLKQLLPKHNILVL